MNNLAMDGHQLPAQGVRPFLLMAVVVVLGPAGIAIEEPFGKFLLHVTDKALPPSLQDWHLP